MIYKSIPELAEALAKQHNLDLDEIGLCGLAYWLRYNHYEQLADLIGNYIWTKITEHLYATAG